MTTFQATQQSIDFMLNSLRERTIGEAEALVEFESELGAMAVLDEMETNDLHEEYIKAKY